MKKSAFSSKRAVEVFKAGRCKRASGVTLIELMAAIAILTITVIGISGYRYYSSLNARLAEQQITAARLGQLLCGTWAGVEGNEAFDLTSALCSDLTVETLQTTYSLPSGFTLFGTYRIIIEDVAYDCILAWNNFSPELRVLWVRIGWDWRQEDQTNPDNALKKSFEIITYVPG